ncbi:MAG: hypothetical protein VB878_09475 [Pirellulaceae bacterium]
MASQVHNHPTRHVGTGKVEWKEFSDAIANVGTKETLIAFRIPRDEIESCEIDRMQHNLAGLIVDGESALASKQRVALFADG